MEAKIIIKDSRKKWMVEEDRKYVCQTFCKQHKRCSTRLGYDCKKFGGDRIPKFKK
ncbi:hypothetical protein AB434_3216 [Heyndrickxia coagulans]|nr:hypothetical protein AB434_3216 [Heyndrickxia coagulans]